MKNSGIYIILNITNGKFYLGSSCDLNKRKNTHFRNLQNNKHHSILLQRAYNKYKKESFEFIIIFNCYKEYNLDYENYFLSLLNPEYNISKDAKAPMTGRRHSNDTIEKFKKRKVKSGKDHHLYNKSPSEETKRKQSLSKIGSKRDEQTKKKMSETAKSINSIGRIDRTKQYCKIIDNDGIIYESMVAAAKSNNVSPATVCDILKGRHSKTRKGKVFRYYE